METLTTIITKTKKDKIMKLVSEGKSRIVITSNGGEWGWTHNVEKRFQPECGQRFRDAVVEQLSKNCTPLKIRIDYKCVEVNAYADSEWLECIIDVNTPSPQFQILLMK